MPCFAIAKQGIVVSGPIQLLIGRPRNVAAHVPYVFLSGRELVAEGDSRGDAPNHDVAVTRDWRHYRPAIT